MKVLMIGDIMGEPGRRSVARLLPKLIANHSIDVVVGNGENVAGGFGITPDLVDDLFDLGGELCCPGMTMVSEAHVLRLEQLVEDFNSDLPRLKEFILPGGTRPAALAHLARTVARRAERSVVSLAAAEAVADNLRRYLNRLSDLLFVLGRALNRAGGRGDVLWVQRKNA